MAVRDVTWTILNADSEPIRRTVICHLHAGDGGGEVAAGSIVSEVRAQSDGDTGIVTFSLEPNANISPAGSWYSFTVDHTSPTIVRHYEIPTGSGAVDLDDLDQIEVVPAGVTIPKASTNPGKYLRAKADGTGYELVAVSGGGGPVDASDVSYDGGTVADALDTLTPLIVTVAGQADAIEAIEDSVGVADGIAALDSGGKVPASQLPSTVMEYQGVWNASTNSPTLVDGVGDAGNVYRVGTAGTQNLGSGSIVFQVGDLVLYDGAVWQRSDGTDLTGAQLAALIHAATAKTAPVDADEFALVDSEASNGLKRATWANLKATIKTYTDTLYVAVSNAGRIPTVVRKAADQSVTSSTTLVDCTDLGFAVVAGQTYYIDGYLLSTGASAGDLAVGATHPGGTLRLSADGITKDASSAPAGTGASVNRDAPITASGGSQTHLGTVTGVTTDARVMGFYTCTANGTFQLQFAQRSSNATATTVLAGSWLRYHT